MAADERHERGSLLTERVLGAIFEVSNNYLRASGVTLCLLANFQKPKVEWKRIVRGLGIPEPFESPAVAG